MSQRCGQNTVQSGGDPICLLLGILPSPADIVAFDGGMDPICIGVGYSTKKYVSKKECTRLLQVTINTKYNKDLHDAINDAVDKYLLLIWHLRSPLSQTLPKVIKDGIPTLPSNYVSKSAIHKFFKSRDRHLSAKDNHVIQNTIDQYLKMVLLEANKLKHRYSE